MSTMAWAASLSLQNATSSTCEDQDYGVGGTTIFPTDFHPHKNDLSTAAVVMLCRRPRNDDLQAGGAHHETQQ